MDEIGYKKQRLLLDLFYPHVDDLDIEKFIPKINKILGQDLASSFLDMVRSGAVDNMYKNILGSDIVLINMYSDKYPSTLADVDNPPIMLYCRGDIDLLTSKCIAVVGTRRITRYGRDVTTKFVETLSRAGYTIVSGLADGVDSVAHTVTLDNGGKTIAVFASGINVIYPATNTLLAKRIVESGGLLVSEYKPGCEPKAYQFPIRNRIIAGLSRGVLITEATLKSGSMHTKKYALEYGRDLFVVPGRITDIYSAGCNEIIHSLQGAMVLDPVDILEAYGDGPVASGGVTKNVEQLSIVEQNILDIIGQDDVHINEIAQKSGLEPKDLMTQLMRLELKGYIKSLGNNIYSK